MEHGKQQAWPKLKYWNFPMTAEETHQRSERKSWSLH